MSAVTHTIDSADGTTIEYRLAGTGPALVIGAGQQSRGAQLRPAGRSVGGRVLGLRRSSAAAGGTAVLKGLGIRWTGKSMTSRRSRTPLAHGCCWDSSRRPDRAHRRTVEPRHRPASGLRTGDLYQRVEFRPFIPFGVPESAHAGQARPGDGIVSPRNAVDPAPVDAPARCAGLLAWLLVGRRGEMRDLMSTTPAEPRRGRSLGRATARTSPRSQRTRSWSRGQCRPGYLTGVFGRP